MNGRRWSTEGYNNDNKEKNEKRKKKNRNKAKGSVKRRRKRKTKILWLPEDNSLIFRLICRTQRGTMSGNARLHVSSDLFFFTCVARRAIAKTVVISDMRVLLKSRVSSWIRVSLSVCVCLYIVCSGSACSVIDPVTRVQILNGAICILHHAKILWERVHPTILLPAMDKL